ncbi:MAG: tyrosine-type recombinase/integrase [Pseudomonadota bacterium]|nr:tyrosine-type recombinase/integrase [Pseudomonadota bacterium]
MRNDNVYPFPATAAPATKNGTVKKTPPSRAGVTNETRRSREHLSEQEVEQLMKAAKGNRNGHRDATMILLAYRHGFRVSELVNLRWDQVDFNQAVLHVNRAKNGSPGTHPLSGVELRALRRLLRDSPQSPFLFISELKSPVTAAGFRKMIERLGASIGFPLKLHPHMFRHSCGYYLANQGVDTRSIQAYLGHRNIQHTVRYTELAADRFRGFWKD